MARLTSALKAGSALILCALPLAVHAQPVSGLFEGGYGSISDTYIDGSMWNGGGTGVVGLGAGWNAQGSLGYGSTDAFGPSIDMWNMGGAFFLRNNRGAMGGHVVYGNSSCSGCGDFSQTIYGLNGEYFFSNNLTVGARGGGYSSSGSSGYALGVGGTFYPVPNIALAGDISTINPSGSFDEAKNYFIGVEILPNSMFPASLSGGFTRTDGAGGGDFNTYSISIKFYAGVPGDGTLISNHRNGPLQAPLIDMRRLLTY